MLDSVGEKSAASVTLRQQNEIFAFAEKGTSTAGRRSFTLWKKP